MKKIWFSILTILTLFVSGCANNTQTSQGPGDGRVIDLAISYQDADLAAGQVLKMALENVGYRVNLVSLDFAIMYMSVAEGDTDATIAAWLPTTHESYMPRFYDDMEDLGPNAEGTILSLAVPSYMDVDSIEDLTDEADQEITGIEPGAGITSKTDEIIESYPNMADFTQKTSSTGGMLIELQNAINRKDDIIITGWTPHWMNIVYDLKYLDDPKGIYGGEESIYTFARKGLAEDDPMAYSVIDNFYWDIDDIEGVIYDMDVNDMEVEDAAEKWAKANTDKINAWYDGVAGLEDAQFEVK